MCQCEFNAKDGTSAEIGNMGQCGSWYIFSWCFVWTSIGYQRIEAEGVPLNPSTFVCHRCESILKPGFNCTVRIEKNVKKAKCRKKTHIPSQNKVVYKCHFCSHPNILRGTRRGYVSSLLPSRPTPETKSNIRCSSTKMTSNSEDKLDQKVDIPLTAELDAVAREVSLEKIPLTPLELQIWRRRGSGRRMNLHLTLPAVETVLLH